MAIVKKLNKKYKNTRIVKKVFLTLAGVACVTGMVLYTFKYINNKEIQTQKENFIDSYRNECIYNASEEIVEEINKMNDEELFEYAKQNGGEEVQEFVNKMEKQEDKSRKLDNGLAASGVSMMAGIYVGIPALIKEKEIKSDIENFTGREK